ncbi:TPA: DEAD/DEAH box helicase family protein, partial [Vibrio alginolyticus]
NNFMHYFYKNINDTAEFKNIILHVTNNVNDVIISKEIRHDLALKLASQVLDCNPIYKKSVSSICIHASANSKEIIDAIAASFRFKKDLLIAGRSIDLIEMHSLLQEAYLIYHACELTHYNKELIDYAIKKLRQAVQCQHVSIEFAIYFASTLFKIHEDTITQQLTSIREMELDALNLSLNFSNAMNIRRLNQIDLSLNRVNVISAETGSGKTTYVIDNYLRHQLNANPNLKVGIISHKNEINNNMYYKISKLMPNAKEASHKTRSLNKLENAQLIISTTNSLPKMRQYVLSCDVVIFDESEKGILSLDGSHYKDDTLKEESFNALKTVITDSKRLIMMDADSTNCITEQLIKSTGIKDYALYKVKGERYSDLQLTIANRDVVLGEVTNKKNRYKVMAFDKKEALYQYLFSIGYESSGKGCPKKALDAGYLVITGDTCDTDAVKHFLANPSVSCFLYEKILYSPYIDSAVSIETNYAREMLVISHSILTPKELIQMGRRFRQAKNIIYAVQKDNVMCYEYTNMNRSGEPNNGPFTFEHMQHLIHHLSTHTRHNMPLSLKLTAEELGFNVKIKEYSPERRYYESMLQEQLEARYVKSVNEAIYQAPNNVSAIDEAYEVIQSGKASNLQLCAAEKRIVAERLCIPIDLLTKEAIDFSKEKAPLLEYLQEYVDWRKTKTTHALFSLMDVLFKNLNISIEHSHQEHFIPPSDYYATYNIIEQLLHNNPKLCKELNTMKTMLKPISSGSYSDGYRTKAINNFLTKLGFETKLDQTKNSKYRRYIISLNRHAQSSIRYFCHESITSLDVYETNV